MEADQKSEVEKLLEAKKKALMEAKRDVLEAKTGAETTGATEEAQAVADASILHFLKKQTEEGRGKALSEAGTRPGLVCSAPAKYVQREAKTELAATGDARAIVALAGPAPVAGLSNAHPASKTSGHCVWGGSTGNVAFVPPKRPPPLNEVRAQAGTVAASLLVRPKNLNMPQMPMPRPPI